VKDFNGKLNVVSLKDYIESIVGALEKNVNSKLDQMDRAVTKAENATERRFEGVNEFRAALQDLTRTFIPRQEIESMFKNTNDKLNAYCAKLDRIESMKQGGNVVWAYVLSGVSLMAALIALVTKFMGS